ncbi:MAG: hypothetical protein E7D92_04600 [Anaerococcus sp.]|uniref:hypothetical protein n=1 Tax=Anaerococcus sp. TaxID=1872515 RepID=UPI0029043EBD|nr:hypothetical protein [Anaerococcus sp.]MDU2353859.1 hypothetical protein [Anaerococcus sp.]
MGNQGKSLYEKIVEDNWYKSYRKNTSAIRDVSKNFNCETLYVGSKKKNANALLRIYDKKKEQLS